MSSRAEQLRALATAIEEFGYCLCEVGPMDTPPTDDPRCPNCLRAEEARREADELDADE